jgi:hypothetical protein
MPKYNFICDSCKAAKQQYTTVDKDKLHCYDCGGVMKRQFPKINGQQVTEKVDNITGVTWKQDQKVLTDNRKENHFWEVEVPRLVQTYSLETCLQNGWLTRNEKGELVIGKPPSKR